MEGDGIEYRYKEYEYMRNGKKVIIKRRWTKQIHEPERVKAIRNWINNNYDITKSVNTNYVRYVNELAKNNNKEPTTITTFNKYYKQEQKKLQSSKISATESQEPKEIQQPLKFSKHSTDSDDSEPST